MKSRNYYIVNGITLWRVLAAPLIVYLAFTRQLNLFKWFLAFSFLTDAVDGYLARKYNVAGTRGAILDSIGDDLTVGAGVVGMFVFKLSFVKEMSVIFILLGGLFVIQLACALIRYQKTTSFHTWLAKAAAILQGVFLLYLFFFPAPSYPLFYFAAFITMLDLLEEIILVLWLPDWEADVKGLFAVIKKKKARS